MTPVPEFKQIYDRAVTRRGGPEALAAELPQPKRSRQLERLPDDRYLAEMTRCVFRSGFVWRVVEAKWPGFEECFFDFEPVRVAIMDDEELDALMKDTRVVRHLRKIQSVRHNAGFVLDSADEHESFGKLVSSWPPREIVGLWQLLKKRGSRLGGGTGPMFLRTVGKDTFLPTKDVTERLLALGVVDRGLSSKRDLEAAQGRFNLWAEESGLPLCQISKILACS